VSTSDNNTPTSKKYEVGVAIVPLWRNLDAQSVAGESKRTGAVPGFDEATGRGRSHSVDRGALLIERGEEAVRVATEAIAAQIGLATQRIATEVGDQLVPSSSSATLGLESINVSFGLTLTAGVQAMFTAQAESSVQVTITLVPQRGSSDPSES
jgi:hypothetical protein